MKKSKKIIIAVLAVIIAALGISSAVYVNDYYRAVDIQPCMASSNKVSVTETDEGFFFDGPGTENALIFYPGAKVEETAYAPVMKSLAENGVDCFLVKMPARLAFFGMNKAGVITEKYSYERYYLAGHSLGGAMAANYASTHQKEFSGLFLLAAYPSEDLHGADFPVVFIYGENDKVLNRKKLEEGFGLVPDGYKTEVIKGGNHSGFASYGKQKNDGEAAVTPEQQQSQTVGIILDTVNN